MNDEDLMLPGEVARLFRVDGKTVNRWANEGKLSCFRTPGGHRRFFRGEIQQIIEGGTVVAKQS